MRRIVAVFISSVFLIVLSACENEEINGEVNGYAFIISELQGTQQDTVFGLGINSLTNKEFSSVKVTADGYTYNLVPYNGHAYNFFYETPREAFSEELPFTGYYYFDYSLVSGEVFRDSMELTDAVVYPAQITDCKFNAEMRQVEVTWERIANNNFIVVLMADAQEKVVFASNALASSATSIAIGQTTSTWQSGMVPSPGEVYKVLVCAYRYRSGSTSVVQAQSKALATVTWGEN